MENSQSGSPSASSGSSEDTCYFCLDQNNEQVYQTQTWRVCDCHMRVHEECLTEWLLKSGKWQGKRPIMCDICQSPYRLEIPFEDLPNTDSKDILSSGDDQVQQRLRFGTLTRRSIWIYSLCTILLVLVVIIVIYSTTLRQ